jgi:radical SAM protein with 4Fe4S-binding SPASM domain
MMDLSERLNLYPKLSAGFCLKGNNALIKHPQDYRLCLEGKVWPLERDFYRLLQQCKGTTTLGQILSCYDEVSQFQVVNVLNSEAFIACVDTYALPQDFTRNDARRFNQESQHAVSMTVMLYHVTNVCNFRCEHCYHNDYVPDPADLTLEQVEKLAESVAKTNVDTIVLSGGEPFLRKDILEIAKIFNKHYIKVQFNTNGSLLTDTLIEKLSHLTLNAVSISVDGPTESIHDCVRKSNNSWAKIFEALPVLRKYNIPVRISSTINKLWLDSINEIPGFLQKIDQLGVYQWSVTRAFKAGEAYEGQFSNTLALNAMESVKISDAILAALHDKPPLNIKNSSICEIYEWVNGHMQDKGDVFPLSNQQKLVTSSEHNILCDVHKYLLQMESNGDVPFCSVFKSRFPMLLGNVKNKDLTLLWDDLCKIRIDNAIPKREHCPTCNLLSYCGGGCPGEDPSPTANLLSSCDKSNYEIMPLIIPRYESLLQKQLALR